MRIISGTYRGKKITAPADLPVRPTTDFAKTGLFNILSNKYRLQLISVLDLYSGTGSLSFEFFSRGSQQITIIDKHPGCIKFIREILQKLNAPDSVKAVQTDAIGFLEKCNSKFDVIVADPPFAITPAEDLISLIFKNNLLTDKGVFILEHASANSYENLEFYKESRKYGNVSFSFFKREN